MSLVLEENSSYGLKHYYWSEYPYLLVNFDKGDPNYTVFFYARPMCWYQLNEFDTLDKATEFIETVAPIWCNVEVITHPENYKLFMCTLCDQVCDRPTDCFAHIVKDHPTPVTKSTDKN